MMSLTIYHINCKIIKKVGAFVIISLSCSMFLNAQVPSLSIGSVGVCENSAVLMPLTGNYLSDIGAITLFINYDDQTLAFNSVENLDPQLSGLLVNNLSNPSRVAIVWSKTSGASFMNSTLLNLKFDLLQQTGVLSFVKNNCEIANTSLPPQIIEVTYTDGSVFPAKPAFSSEPENKTAVPQSNVVFQVASPNATAFKWQESRDNGSSWSDIFDLNPYSGSRTNTLTIRQVTESYDRFMYRCILDPDLCFNISKTATLSVDSHSGIPGQRSKDILYFNTSPNPFSGKTTLEYTVPGNGFVTIQLFSMTGQLMDIPVESQHTAGSYRTEKNFVSLPAGIYFCHYVFKGTAGVYETYRKMIRIN